MDMIKIAEDIARHRRRVLGAAGVTVAAALLGVVSSAAAQPANTGAKRLPAIKPGTNTSWGAKADGRRSPEHRLRRSRSRQRTCRRFPARLAVRHS
jgi:hypothetical protein